MTWAAESHRRSRRLPGGHVLINFAAKGRAVGSLGYAVIAFWNAGLASILSM